MSRSNSLLSTGASRLHRVSEQRSQRGNSRTGTPIRAQSPNGSGVSGLYGGVRSVSTCGPSWACTADSSRRSVTIERVAQLPVVQPGDHHGQVGQIGHRAHAVGMQQLVRPQLTDPQRLASHRNHPPPAACSASAGTCAGSNGGSGTVPDCPVLAVQQQPDALVHVAQRRLAGHPVPRPRLRPPQQADHVIGRAARPVIGEPPPGHLPFLAPLVQPRIQLAFHPGAHPVVTGDVPGPALEVADDVIGQLVVPVERAPP